MTEQTDWRARYEELLKQHETELAAEAALGKVLTQTIVRLTLAASGLDPQLDPHLKDIRDAVRAGVTPSLEEHLTRMSDSLMHYSEESAASTKVMEHLCERLAERIPLSAQQGSELKRLLDSLLSQSGSMEEEEQERLVDLLYPASGSGGAGKKGLIGRLFKGSGAAESREEEQATNRILLNLLEQASWPGHWSGEIAEMKNRLAGQPMDKEWVEVLEDLLSLSARTYGEAKAEIKAAEDFLGELTQRLQDIEEHLRQAHTGRSELVEQGRKMSDTVSSQMGGLYSTVSEATDLAQLKLDVNRRLSEIRETLNNFIQEEQRWYQGAESTEQQLRERLSKLEDESKELRHRLLEAHHMALRDAVTELPNRLAYEERVAQEYARWKRFDEPLSMLVWDVDNFKAINDRYGHHAGDKALKVIARCLRKRLRETDFIARYGGEELVVLLVGAGVEDATRIANEMRLAVENGGLHANGKPVAVTVSGGLSLFEVGDAPAAVFERADKAMYAAKKAGKHQVVAGHREVTDSPV